VKTKHDTALAIRLAQEIYEEVVGSKMLVHYAKDGALVKRALESLDGDIEEFLARWRVVLTHGDPYLWCCDLSSFCVASRFNKAGVLAAAERQERGREEHQQAQRDSWAASVAKARERRQRGS
jgi:hypothetical protein